MKKLHKFLALALACLMFAMLFSGCGSAPASQSEPASSAESPAPSSEAAPEAPSEEMVTVKYVMPGNAPADLDRVQGAINAKLAADNVGVQVEQVYIPWDVWDQKINIMLSTGEEFDLFFVMNDRVSIQNYVAKGGIAEIGEEIKKYGPNIIENTSDLAFKSAQVNDKTYAIPAEWIAPEYDRFVFWRQDVADKLGIDKPTNFKELTDAMQIAFDNWERPDPPYYPICPMTHLYGATMYLFSSSNGWLLNNKMIYVNQDGTIENFFKTEEFKEICNNAHEWYQKGFIDPDILTVNMDAYTNHAQSCNWFVAASNFADASGQSAMKENWPELTPDDFTWINFFPDGKALVPYGTRNLNAVPLSSKHPEAAVKLYNWIYESEENYRLFQYGEEGKDYVVNDKGVMSFKLDENGQIPYVFSTWNSGNFKLSAKWTPFDHGDTPNCYYESTAWAAENLEDGYAASLVFNPSNVQTEMSDVTTQIDTYILPMALGVVDYDSHIDEALKMLDAAGIEKIVEEYKAQLAAIK